MTSSVTRQMFNELANADTGPCVSIVVPFDRQHPDDYLAHTTLKDLTHRAKAQLAAHDSVEIDNLLAAPIAALQGPLVSNGRSATGFYSSPGFSIELPLSCPAGPLCVVDDRFHVSSLLPALADDVSGFVLTVGAEHVQLYRITDSTLQQCRVPELEHSVDDALWFDRVERHVGSHSGQSLRQGGVGTISHGSGAQAEDRKRRLERFYHYVDRTVLDFLGARRTQPLLLVGTTPEVARFQHVTRHPHAVALPGGSPARLSPSELEARSLQALRDPQPLIESIVQRFAALNGTGRASNDLATILEAAAQGRVDTLLVADPVPVWGTFVDGHVALSGIDGASQGRVDLINLAVSDAWRTGATVATTTAPTSTIAPADQMAPGSPLAAIFRY